MIAKCTCKNEYQDKRYGTGMRVKNDTKGGGTCCTSCGLGAKTRQASWKLFKHRH